MSFPNRQKAIMEYVFEMESGYVLDFSNTTFKTFFMSLTDIDVFTEPGYRDESSKAKKFRYFLENEDDMTVAKVVIELLERREILIEKKKAYDEEYVDKYIKQALELKKYAEEVIGGSAFASNDERFNADLIVANSVLADLIKIGERICNNKTYNTVTKENTINDAIRDALCLMGYDEVKDQTRHGLSGAGKDAGLVDILLSKSGKEVAIIEGLKLKSVDTADIVSHINKSINNYNALGTATFLCAYVSADDYGGFWKRYIEFVNTVDFEIQKKSELQELPYPNAAIRVARMIFSRDGFDYPFFLVTFKLLR